MPVSRPMTAVVSRLLVDFLSVSPSPCLNIKSLVVSLNIKSQVVGASDGHFSGMPCSGAFLRFTQVPAQAARPMPYGYGRQSKVFQTLFSLVHSFVQRLT